MEVIYDSRHYWIFSYPAQQGFELFDKTRLRTAFLQGALAWRFRLAMEGIPAARRSQESVDALLDGYCDEFARPIVFH